MDRTQQFSALYRQVERQISNALDDVSGFDVSNDEGKRHLSKVKEKLAEMKGHFNSEIAHLEKHSEWEKFTIAFFGETNAGKSTIIESLRILFDEKKRQEKIDRKQAEVNAIQADFLKNSDNLIEALSTHYIDFADNVADLAGHINRISEQMQKELQYTKQLLVRSEKEYLQCQEQISSKQAELKIADDKLQDTQSRLVKALHNQATLRLELEQAGKELKDAHADYQCTQIKLTDAERQIETAQRTGQAQARVRLIVGLAVGAGLGALAGALGYALFM